MVTKTSVGAKVQCPHKEKCSDAESGTCNSCRHNELRSYYEPTYRYPYYVPYYPHIVPDYPYWWGTTTATYGTTANAES
ncbi:hypothetical protein LCGC14_2375730 [marine sediment metagenome]|uniref:Uncharacterized protein n=1 Tax=marine sediment metagenome TaxID=412755 RepID=A0A0F9EX28_9ZZZZ